MVDTAAAYPYAVSPRKPPPELMSVDAAAKEVGLGPATVWRYLERGLLKRYHPTIGRKRTLIDVHQLRELLDNPPTEEAPTKAPPE